MPTTNYLWPFPEDGGDEGAWGQILNDTLEDIDEDVKAVSTVANGALTKTGVTAQTGRLDTKAATMARVTRGSVSGAVVLNLETGLYIIATITGTTAFTFSNVPSGAFVTGVILRLTNAGAHTVSFPAEVKWPGGVQPGFTADGVDIVVLLTDDSGTTFRAMVAGRDIR